MDYNKLNNEMLNFLLFLNFNINNLIGDFRLINYDLLIKKAYEALH